tara:strand:- start:124 stop:456 length:333 start_codon:yes stop_codon:yes gene_type:complete
MNKFLKITLSDEPTLIPISDVADIRVGVDTKVYVILNTTALRAANDAEMLAFEITATTAADATKTKAQLTSLANLIEEALTTSWTNPVMDITSRLTYAPTAVAKVTIDWA